MDLRFMGEESHKVEVSMGLKGLLFKHHRVAAFLIICLMLFSVAVPAGASTSLPNEIYLKQEYSETCTLADAAMMLRARAYLSGYSDWRSITESGITAYAWIQGTGLRAEFTYPFGSNSIKVNCAEVSGISFSSLQSVLSGHPEGIILYARASEMNKRHAVFVTDCEGGVVYCADSDLNGQYAGQRIPLTSSYLGQLYGSQDNILAHITTYWYVSSYNIQGLVAFDVNGYLDGKKDGSLLGYGTFDVYISDESGTLQKVASNVNDYCNNSVPIGRYYQISNIKANTRYQYNGVYSGTQIGQLTEQFNEVVLSFSEIKTTPTAISIPSSLNVQAGKSSTLSVTFTPSDSHSDYKGVTWSSSNQNVATVNSSGQVTGVSEGTAVITATSTYNSRLKATCTVTVTKAIPVPEITTADVDGYMVHLAWEPSALIDDSDVRVYNVAVYRNYSSRVFYVNGFEGTSCDVTLSNPGNYRATVTAVNQTTGDKSNIASRSFTVDWIITEDWQTANSLPSNVNAETCDIEYKHTYRTTAESSPGSGWSQVSGSGNTTYVDDGAVRETEYQEQTSDTCVLVGSYYYHFCGANAYGAEHYKTDSYTDRHVAGALDQFNIVDSWPDSADSRLRQYKLSWIGGQWAGQAALCAAERTDIWYPMYQYQNRKAVTTYTWTKTTDWTATLDSSAYSVQYRFRLKDTTPPIVESLNVTAVTPRDYTLLCNVADDVGIAKVVFYSWLDNESPSDAVVHEITVDNSPKQAEVSATVAVADHGSVTDAYYNTKVFVYDVRGKVTEYSEDSGKVYMPTLLHSSSKLILPADLLTIEEGTFDNVLGFGEVVLPEGAVTIGSRAFAGCSGMTLIFMPDSIEEIEEDAFTGSDNVVFLCASNNVAAAFARENGIPYFTGE